MKYCTNCVSPSSAPLPGKTSSNGCYYALRQNKNIISASNSSPSHSLTLESFAQVKTCNQFNRNFYSDPEFRFPGARLNAVAPQLTVVTLPLTLLGAVSAWRTPSAPGC